jgi:hypothetical protein
MRILQLKLVTVKFCWRGGKIGLSLVVWVLYL